MASARKWLRNITKAAEKQGWRVRETRQGRMFYAPDGEGIVTVHTSGGSDHRNIQNAESEFRRAGLEI